MMSSTVALLKIQYRQLRLATSIILITIAFWIITLILVYPGDEGLKSLVEVFQRPEFQAVIGTFPEGANYYFGFWQLFGIYSLMPIAIFGIGLYYGVEITTREAAENTFDIGFVIPESRVKILTTRLVSTIGIYLSLLFLTGVLSTIISSMIMGISLNIETLVIVWIVMIVLGFIGITLGMFVGTLYFDRGIAVQIVFFLIAFEFLLNTFINSGAELDKTMIDFLKLFSVQSYYNLSDILFLEKYNLFNIGLLTIGAVFLSIVTLLLFRRRNLLETTYPPLYSYLSPFYWKQRRKIRQNMAQSNNGYEINSHTYGSTKEVPASKLLIAWSLKFKNKLPMFTDELWAHGFFLTIYGIFVFLIIFLQLIFYPGTQGALDLIEAFKSTPLYYMFGEGIALERNPYFFWLTTNYFTALWFYYLPYVVYRFYHLELRDNGKTDELLWSKPINHKQIYLQRTLAVIVEYFILMLISVIGVIIPDIMFGQTAHSLEEIVIIMLSGPIYLFIGIFISFLITLERKYGKLLAIVFVVFVLMFFLIGSVSPDYKILAKISPLYYYNPVDMLYNGIGLQSLLEASVFTVLAFVFIIFRLRRIERVVA